jgi:transposase-like protein
MHLRKKKEKFGDIDPRFQHLEKELHLRMRSAKTSAPPATLFKVRGGRRKLSEYLCKGCPRKFETYNKKRDHQKHCINKKRNVSMIVPESDPRGD